MKIGELFNVAGFGVIVTGGASGLGLGYAEALAANGARVTLLDVDAARIDAETRRLAAQGWAVRGEVVDVCDHASIECAFDAALAARLMRPQRSGRMIVTTSVAAYQCEPAISAAYMTAKAGAAHLMRSVALELAADNITVNAIAPGFFATNIGGGHAKTASVQEAMGKVIPIHRVGFPADMAGLALFLASPASAYLTGQQISIDGGWSLGVAD